MPTHQRRASIWRENPGFQRVNLPTGVVACADALDFLNQLKPQCADIVFLDPPFNLGKRYGSKTKGADRRHDIEYFRYMTRIVDRSAEVLKEGGALYMYHIPKWALQLAPVMSSRLTFRHWIAVSMKNGFVRGQHLYPAHYALLYFTKGPPRTFRRPKIKADTCRFCGEYVKDYGGYEPLIRDGINLSDVWEDVSPVRHKTRKYRDSNELPIMIPERAVRISGGRGRVLVDPFAGAGTSAVAAINHGMRFAVCDSQESYCKLTVSRLREAMAVRRRSASRRRKTPKRKR